MLHNLLIHKGTPINSIKEEVPGQFPNPFSYIPCSLCREAALSVRRYLQQRPEWHNELQSGKMFGVLVVEAPGGEMGYLAAFSGNLQGRNDHHFFVPPVYDLLNPDNFFKTGEREISALNREIEVLEQTPEYVSLIGKIETGRREFEAEIDRLKRVYMDGKAAREEQRRRILGGGIVGAEDFLNKINRESQFQKGEIKRAERRMKKELESLELELQGMKGRIDALKRLRKEKSAALQEEIFESFTFLNAKGENKSLLQIFREYYNDATVLPPGGAGECAAPKLLQYAYLNGFRPISMAEFWWGDSPKGEIRKDGEFYPSCKGKCAPILGFMLQGLDVAAPVHSDFSGTPKVLYEDEWIIAVDKLSGLLSVKGKDPLEKCVLDYLVDKGYFVVHRLDMHTSGVLLLAKTEAVYKEMQRQFACREVEKCYLAVLDGVVSVNTAGDAVKWENGHSGEISLPLAPDYAHRPCQKADFESGKESVTRFEVVGSAHSGVTVVKFYPLTGRTHQLRIHSAHPLGLNVPIVGDLLYGKPAERLMLHAWSVKFKHPVSHTPTEIIAPVPAGFCPRKECF